ncbi:MAG: hypothetical protein KAH35_09755 [Candidatus Atribacteria bacterium]|nr:hypothetical protein [Candidatus Atribacteria bacterium]
MYKQILKELKEHMPFTSFGAATGIILIIFFQKLPSEAAYNIFYILHPLHVFLSACKYQMKSTPYFTRKVHHFF